MRTSRPQKHAPRQLLKPKDNVQSKAKGKGKALTQDQATESSSAYSYGPSSRSKGVKRAERRIEASRKDVRDSNERGRNAKKPRRKAGKDDENDEQDDEEDEFGQSGSGLIDGTMDISGIKFKLGVGSDEEAGDNDDDEDEEIDSDLADTDSEGSSEDESQKRPKPSASKGMKKRALASDFYKDQPVEVDLNEDSDTAEDDELSEDGFMDISEMLGPASKVRPQEDKVDTDEEDVSEDEEEEEDVVVDDDDDDDDDDESLDSDEEQDDPEALARLGALVGGLPTTSVKKRPNEEVDDASPAADGAKKRKRNALGKERTEAVPEGEYAATGGGNNKLTLDSMLSGLSGPQAAALKKSLRPLASASKDNIDESDALSYEHARLSAAENALLARERAKADAAKSSNPLKGSGALPAPLAPLHQAKLERIAAKERMGEEVKKWDDTVKAMRGISTREGADAPEQRLILPLRTEGEGKGTSGAELVAQFNPQNDMEKQIAALISSTGMSSKGLLATESSALMDALPTNSSEKSAAHDAKRTAQLRLARDLMFRAERKAKRVAKIKSRTFRKIAKKSRARALAEGEDGEGQLTMEEMAQLDALDGGDRMQEERERLETLRAKERATLRHASGGGTAAGGGRWAKGLKGMEGMNDDLREAIRTRESKQELLRRKILGNDDAIGSDDDLSPSGSEGSDDEDDAAIKASAYESLSQLRSNSDGKKELPKGLMGMKFMQKALAQKDAQVDKMVDDFAMQVGDEADNREEFEEQVGKGGELVKGNPGRMVFGPTPGSQPVQDDAQDNINTKKTKKGNSSRTGGNVTTAQNPASSIATLTDYNPFSKLSSMDTPSSRSEKAKEDANPWLSHDVSDSLHVSRKSNDSQNIDKASTKMQKEKNKSKEALKKVRDDARVDIDLDRVLAGATPAHDEDGPAEGAPKSPPVSSATAPPNSSPDKAARRRNREMAPPPSSSAALRTRAADATDDSDDHDNEDDLPEALKKKQGPQAFKQRDLVARAFAGDDVVADFEAMKAAEIAADAPQEEDMTLPGWGAWGGKGVKKNKANARKVVKKLPGIDADKRKDAKLKHVIISERTDKKANKYMVKDLPFPYTSKAQYEQKMAQPTGVGWTTRGTFKEMTTPKVLVKPGQVIKPVSKQV